MNKKIIKTRKFDELGRLVIPIEIRNKFGIEEKDPLEIYIEKDSIVLKKYQETCMFCEGKEELIKFKDKIICKSCINNINIK